jgi:hypothetical protein
MQPGMAGLFGAERQQLVVGVVACTAAEAAAGRRPNGIAVEPLDDAAGEGAGLGGRMVVVVVGLPGRAGSQAVLGRRRWPMARELVMLGYSVGSSAPQGARSLT